MFNFTRCKNMKYGAHMTNP